jgi:hypothetical protein
MGRIRIADLPADGALDAAALKLILGDRARGAPAVLRLREQAAGLWWARRQPPTGASRPVSG